MIDLAEESARTAWPQMLIVLGVLGLAFLLTISLRQKAARREAGRLSPRERLEQIRDVHSDAADARVVEAQLTDHARRLAAMIDNKSQRLEQLIALAEDRLAALQRVAGNGNGHGTAADSDPAPLDPLTRAVYELADAGRRPLDIAQELDEQVGKVELILALRRR
jgi:hypothetical protein